MFTTKLLQSTADFFNGDKLAVSINFDAKTGLKDARRLDDIGAIAIRALNNDFVIFNASTLEIVSKVESKKLSKGHVDVIGKLEYFFFNDQLYRAPFSNPLDLNGYRLGARWQCPKRYAQDFINQVQAFC
jgi:hypothetical protein